MEVMKRRLITEQGKDTIVNVQAGFLARFEVTQFPSVFYLSKGQRLHLFCELPGHWHPVTSDSGDMDDLYMTSTNPLGSKERQMVTYESHSGGGGDGAGGAAGAHGEDSRAGMPFADEDAEWARGFPAPPKSAMEKFAGSYLHRLVSMMEESEVNVEWCKALLERVFWLLHNNNTNKNNWDNYI